MNRALIQRGLGVALILSGLVLLVLKVLSIPEARQSWDSWAAPDSGTALFIGALAFESVLLAGRFALGYCIYSNKHLGPWLFYALAVLVAISGVTGIILAAACIAIRLSSNPGHAVKT